MGGAAKVVRDHARAFAAFAEVREVVFNKTDGVDLPGKEIICLNVEGGGGLLAKIRNFRTRVVRYSALKRAFRPDISIAHLEGAHYVDLLSRTGEKNVVVLHGSMKHNREVTGAMGLLRKHLLVPLVLRRADAIVAVSRDMIAEWQRGGLKNIRVINNFFDIAGIERRAREPLDQSDEALFERGTTLVALGRLAPPKNLHAMLAIVARLAERRPVRLLLLGEGPLRSSLIERAGALGLSVRSPWTDGEAGAQVEFLGAKPNPLPYLARGDLFVLPSAWEGFPLALCEAMACGAAVAAADCPTGPSEILGGEGKRAASGVLLPVPDEAEPETIEAWVEALDRLLGDESERKRLSWAARKRVRDFSEQSIIPQWLALFEELLGRPVIR